jgi:hypothetical protein
MGAVAADNVVVELEARLDKAKNDVSLYTRSFERDMDKVVVAGAKAEGGMVKAGAGAAAGLNPLMLAGGAAVIVLAGLAAAAKEAEAAMDFADKTADTAQSLHLTTDAVQEYQYALQRAGGDQKDFASGFNSFSEKLGQAKRGIKEAAEAYHELGFTDADIAKFKDADTALQAVADKVSQLANPAEQDAIIKALGAEKLAPLLRDGSTEMTRLRDEAQKIGVVMDASLVKKAAAAKDEFDTMKKVVDVELKSAFVDLIPVINVILGMIAQMAKLAGEVVDKFRSIENKRSAAIQDEADLARSQNTGLLRRSGGNLSPSERTVFQHNLDIVARATAELTRRAVADQASTGTGGSGHLERTTRVPKGTKADPIIVDPAHPIEAFGFDQVSDREQLNYLNDQARKRATAPVDTLTDKGLEIFDPDAIMAAATETAIAIREAYADNVRDGIIDGLEAVANGDGLDYFLRLFRQKTFEAMANAIASALAGQQGGGGLGGALATVGTFLFGRAAGGNVVAGQPYFVHRDEVFTPPQSGKMVTAGQRASKGGDWGGLLFAPTFDLRGAVVTEDLLRQMNQIGQMAYHAATRDGAQLAQAQMARNARQVLR